MTNVERVERAGQGRALLMLIAAIILLINVMLQWGDPAYMSAGARGGSWLVMIGLWAVVLATGGGLGLSGPLRAVLNDELTRSHRSRAVSFGFYAAILASLSLLVLSWSSPIAVGDALKLVSAVGMAAALVCFAALELRSSH